MNFGSYPMNSERNQPNSLGQIELLAVAVDADDVLRDRIDIAYNYVCISIMGLLLITKGICICQR